MSQKPPSTKPNHMAETLAVLSERSNITIKETTRHMVAFEYIKNPKNPKTPKNPKKLDRSIKLHLALHAVRRRGSPKGQIDGIRLLLPSILTSDDATSVIKNRADALSMISETNRALLGPKFFLVEDFDNQKWRVCVVIDCTGQPTGENLAQFIDDGVLTLYKSAKAFIQRVITVDEVVLEQIMSSLLMIFDKK